jgi:hypothetical protein
MLKMLLARRGAEEELVQGFRILCVYEAMTHASTCPVVLGNEPSNVRGQGIRERRAVRASGKVRSFTGSKADQSKPLVRWSMRFNKWCWPLA